MSDRLQWHRTGNDPGYYADTDAGRYTVSRRSRAGRWRAIYHGAKTSRLIVTVDRIAVAKQMCEQHAAQRRPRVM